MLLRRLCWGVWHDWYHELKNKKRVETAFGTFSFSPTGSVSWFLVSVCFWPPFVLKIHQALRILCLANSVWTAF